jgi:hypothetical protein
MGFERNKVYTLVFEGEDYEGLEVRARGLSMASVLRAVDIASFMSSGNLGLKDVGRIDELFRLLAGCPKGCEAEHEELENTGWGHYPNKIISWNLEEEGVPVPADYAGLTSLDFDFAQDVVMAWLDGIIGTPGPLEQTSKDGTPSVEELMSMALPSDVQQN